MVIVSRRVGVGLGLPTESLRTWIHQWTKKAKGKNIQQAGFPDGHPL